MPLNENSIIYSSFDETEQQPPVIHKLENGKLKANFEQLFRYYKAFVPESIFMRIPDSDGFVIFTKAEYNKMHKEHSVYQSKMQKLNICVQLNNKGIELEKLGEIDAAISIYEQNIKDDCYPERHSFDRLLVLYRKSKDYINEKRVCLQAIKVFTDVAQDVSKYSNRLEKINILIDKSILNGVL